MTKLLIDGDEFLYAACAATEVDVRWEGDTHVLMSNEQEAWDTFSRGIDKLAEKFGTQDLLLCFSWPSSDRPNFRMGIDPTYKSNRKGKRKPLCYSSVRERAEGGYKTKSFPGLEADDVMGILATKPGADAIIISQDKDMKTIPGRLWTGSELLTITHHAAEAFHMAQTLTGDASDGYKGCPGMGPKGAEKLLETCRHNDLHPWPAIVAAYVKQGLTEDDALRNARLARILRWNEWDREKKEPILWTYLGPSDY